MGEHEILDQPRLKERPISGTNPAGGTNMQQNETALAFMRSMAESSRAAATALKGMADTVAEKDRKRLRESRRRLDRRPKYRSVIRKGSKHAAH